MAMMTMMMNIYMIIHDDDRDPTGIAGGVGEQGPGRESQGHREAG